LIVRYYDPLNPNVATATLSILRVNSWEVRPVYSEDGLDYLYDHFRFSFQFMVNDFATHANRTIANTAFPPLPVSGFPRSLEYLARVLRIPRLRLEISENNLLIFRSHGQVRLGGQLVTAACDVAGGPKPISFRGREFSGLKTFLGTWEVESWCPRQYQTAPDGGRAIINNNDNEVGALPAQAPTARTFVLSHRWSTSDSINEKMFTTRTTTGKAVFDLELLQAAQYGPDDLRAAGIFHLLPNNFARTNVNVQMSSDGASLNYSVTDTEQPANLGGNSNVVSVNADMRVDTVPQKFPFLEQLTATISCQVQGRPGVSRTVLYQTVLNVLQQFGFNPRQNFGLFNSNALNPCFQISSGYDAFNLTAWATASFMTGRNIFNDAAGFIGNPGQFLKLNNGVLTPGDNVNGLIPLNAPSGPVPRVNFAYETVLEKMVAQALNSEGIAWQLNRRTPAESIVAPFLPRPDNL
jgi:hypothetical protein